MDMEGRWEQDSGFETMGDILDTVGLRDTKVREMILSLKPEIELLPRDDDIWEYNLITPHSTQYVTFRSGEVIDYVSLIGRPVKAELTIEGYHLIEIHRDPANQTPETRIIRDFNGDFMITTFRVGDVECVGKYKRVK